MKIRIILFFFIAITTAYAQAPVGKVMSVKGKLFINSEPALEGTQIHEKDSLETGVRSFAKITLYDDSAIYLSQNSKMKFTQYSGLNQPRFQKIKLILGKFRIWVQKHLENNEKYELSVQQIQLGVRGTQFLVNAYEYQGSPATDVLMLEGLVKLTGAGIQPFELNKAQFVNSQQLARSGLSAVGSLDLGIVKRLIDNKDSFLPHLSEAKDILKLSQIIDTNIRNQDNEVKIPTFKPVNFGPFEKTPKKTIADKAKEKTKVVSKLSGVVNFKYQLNKEKWDIREAVTDREKNLKNNNCYYFYYKKIPGSVAEKRFRGERDCEDFEYEL